ncbi:MAG TPA: WXG100 family type VII secretion target [Acidimicrobiales bacterium]|nr:WXG100 family type VII secretion target [Acidimicrobiales bacterium]
MANSITVGYEGLQQAANQLRSGKQELVGTLRNLQSVIDGLTSSGFKTRVASGRFGQHHQRWDQSTQELLGSLDEISRAIQDARQKHEQADATLAAGVAGIGAAGVAGIATAARRGGSGTTGSGAIGSSGTGGSGRGPRDPGYSVVPENRVRERLREVDRSWGARHGDGSRSAYDRVTLPNGDRYTRNQGMQVTVTRDMLRDGPRTSSPPPALRESLPGFDSPYRLQLAHLWADRLGGPNVARNFVAGHAHTNGGGMAYVEGRVADAIKRSGSVELVALPHFVGDEAIPRSILYAWKAPGDSSWTAVNIKNLP